MCIKVHSPNLLEKYICELVGIGCVITFPPSKLWKAKLFILCGVMFLVRLQEHFEIDHFLGVNGLNKMTRVDHPSGVTCISVNINSRSRDNRPFHMGVIWPCCNICKYFFQQQLQLNLQQPIKWQESQIVQPSRTTELCCRKLPCLLWHLLSNRTVCDRKGRKNGGCLQQID